LLGKEVPVLVSTFHSFCVRLLRSHAGRVGLKPNFIIVDSEDKKRLLKEVVKELNLDSELYSPSALSSVISNIKNGTFSLESAGIYYERISPIFETYNKKLKELNAVDFDDLLLYGREILKSEDLKNYYQDFFQYLLIDEYQDTNKVQYEIARSLTEKKGNICVVGDEDQCIYTWRGANIENILSFERDFKNAKVIKLEKNYRCTKVILEAANAVVSNNRLRKGKRLYTDNETGEPIRLFRAETDSEEALFVARGIRNLLRKGVSPRDIAVFYRTNALSRAIEDALRREGISYQIVGGVKFYERKEVKDILAYLRLSLFDEDLISLFRILNVPKRGLGSGAEERLRKITEEEMSWREALKRLEEELRTEKQKRAVRELRETLEILREKVEELPPYDFVKFIVSAVGYEEYLRREFKEEFEQRLENVRELGNTIQEFAEKTGLRGEELYVEFLTTTALSSDQDQIEDSEKVTLMTVHASKGLEFPVVFVTGLEEGIFPHFKSSDSSEEIEEERRLFYVAMTRAKKLLNLSYARKRRTFGTLRDTRPSRFISEIPNHLLKEVRKRSERRRGEELKEESRPKLVFHKKYGKGVVKRIEGRGENAKVTAFFSNFGEKTIIMKFLEILS
ncbi:MAG: DNA helicase UvrD, partial [Thermovibrio sp.]